LTFNFLKLTLKLYTFIQAGKGMRHFWLSFIDY